MNTQSLIIATTALVFYAGLGLAETTPPVTHNAAPAIEAPKVAEPEAAKPQTPALTKETVKSGTESGAAKTTKEVAKSGSESSGGLTAPATEETKKPTKLPQHHRVTAK
jgi:hypothetical protein